MCVPASCSPVAAGATQSVAEFSGQYYSPSDLTMYMNQFDITGEPSVTLVGQNDASNPGIEAQMGMCAAAHAPRGAGRRLTSNVLALALQTSS